jgi:hypothetical protein
MDCLITYFFTNGIYTAIFRLNFRLEVFLISNRHPKVPHVPFAPIVPLFPEPVDSELYAFLKEVHTLIETAPSLVDAVEKDLDAHGLRKKEGRLADKEWLANQTPNLSGLPEPDQAPGACRVVGKGTRLQHLRHRTPTSRGCSCGRQRPEASHSLKPLRGLCCKTG